ncbi:expressed unknown protein [Seminavis robusta]|uniref:Uncharacterized protein n=1 Tax=Seminavis robusta TaxID=568900 RepID=A0A9N8DS47_9STRA|nr:expressed unknown protein [Seminavis robusta]|eukprot:Sro243_g096820.1 n/a (214) ;mRNA; r:26225-26866
MRTISAITLFLGFYLTSSQALELRASRSLIKEDLLKRSHDRSLVTIEDVDLEVYQAALEDPSDANAISRLAEDQDAFLHDNSDIILTTDFLANGQASKHLQEIGFPGMERLDKESMKELDAYFFGGRNGNGCGNFWCETPATIALYGIINVGAIITKFHISAIAAALAIPTGASSAVIGLVLGIAISLGATAGNALVGTIVHEACCNIQAYEE